MNKSKQLANAVLVEFAELTQPHISCSLANSIDKEPYYVIHAEWPYSPKLTVKTFASQKLISHVTAAPRIIAKALKDAIEGELRASLNIPP
jgi:hypothetical protein